MCENENNKEVVAIKNFKKRWYNIMAVKPIKATTEVSDKKIADEIRRSAFRKPSEKAKKINKSALKLLKKMRDDN